MTELVLLELVTPKRKFLSREVEEVTMPGEDGDFGVLRGHVPFLSSLRAGEVRLRTGDRVERFVINYGFSEVLPHQITLLTDEVVAANEIDVKAVQDASVKALNTLSGLSEEEVEYMRVKHQYDYLQAQLEVAKGK